MKNCSKFPLFNRVWSSSSPHHTSWAERSQSMRNRWRRGRWWVSWLNPREVQNKVMLRGVSQTRLRTRNCFWLATGASDKRVIGFGDPSRWHMSRRERALPTQYEPWLVLSHKPSIKTDCNILWSRYLRRNFKIGSTNYNLRCWINFFCIIHAWWEFPLISSESWIWRWLILSLPFFIISIQILWHLWQTYHFSTQLALDDDPVSMVFVCETITLDLIIGHKYRNRLMGWFESHNSPNNEIHGLYMGPTYVADRPWWHYDMEMLFT